MLDLEDPFEVELVDWDEEDIDGAAPGMDVADAEAADAMAAHLTTMSSASKTAPPAMDPTGSVPVEHPKPTMNSALKTMPPDPARSAPVEHPKPPGASRPPVLGRAGEARAGRATAVSPAKDCTASGRSVTSPGARFRTWRGCGHRKGVHGQAQVHPGRA